jgi:hypothetical protein
MGAPAFTITTAVVTSVRRYFQWKSTEGLTWTVTGSDAAINGVYEYIGQSQYYDMILKYYRDTTDSTKIFITSDYYGEYRAIFGTTASEPIMAENQWPSYIHTDMVFGDASLTEYWYENQNNNSYTLPPTFASASNGTGLFSWQLDATGWSADSSYNFVELTGLIDTESHTLYIREKLQDESYTTSAEQPFTVTFDNGSMVIVPAVDTVNTDLSSHTVNFTFPSYESKLLSGLTTDTFGLMGLWTYCGMKNDQPAYIKDDRYLWYEPNTNRWVVTQASYYDGTYSFDDYYYSYMYADTTGTAFTTSGWSIGMEADMGQIGGTLTWSSGVFAIMPIGTNAARYRVDGGGWIDLAQDSVSFDLNMSLGSSYSVEIQELLENGLYTDSATVNITCELISAPVIATTDGSTVSADGRNVILQWFSTNVPDDYWDGTELAKPHIFDLANATDYDGGKLSPEMDVADQSASMSCCMVKLLPNTTYYMMVPEREGNMYNSVYKPDLSIYIAQHDYEHAYETITTGDDGGLWIYAVHDQGWGTWWKLAVKPTPEEITAEDIQNFYAEHGNGSGLFRLRTNSSVWSEETSEHRALQIFQLPTGDNLIEVQEKSANGIWSETGSMTLSVTNGSEPGSSGGITVPDGKYLVVLNPATGNEFLWDGVADLSDLELLTE